MSILEVLCINCEKTCIKMMFICLKHEKRLHSPARYNEQDSLEKRDSEEED